ncbi:hypothetical protein HF576_02040 [Microbacterium sp. CFH 90308]|uniref:Uncharacterized protein n=1 Tax=Microbacterium salsuginis TaxID=2722803 RepID=A0ABX1K918_9MICO|nr:hypothetical protein [Microbacterium sp. CFH 90308]NLP82620.1 hypothetical protein [Microbacterium sp. CFH 90308]
MSTSITRVTERTIVAVDLEDDGSIEIRTGGSSGYRETLTAEQARQLAAGLLELADESEKYFAETAAAAIAVTVHAAPIGTADVTACCGVLPWHLPSIDRITSTDSEVTCTWAATARAECA